MPRREPPAHIARLLDAPREVRSYAVQRVELRQADDGSLTFDGYASVYGTEYEMYGGPPWGWIESVEPGAGAKSLGESPDVQLLVNHGGLPLARTKSGTMTLAEDKVGLNPVAQLDPTDPDVQRIRPKIERGDLDEMSFAFRVTRQEWDEEYTRRWIREYNIHRGDVSIVSYGANPATSFSLRDMLAAADPRLLLEELRAAGRYDDVAAALLATRTSTPGAPTPAPPVDPSPEIARRLAELDIILRRQSGGYSLTV